MESWLQVPGYWLARLAPTLTPSVRAFGVGRSFSASASYEAREVAKVGCKKLCAGKKELARLASSLHLLPH